MRFIKSENIQEHLLSAYTALTMALEDLGDKGNESSEAEELREIIDSIWNLMLPDTQGKARDIATRIGKCILDTRYKTLEIMENNHDE